MNDPKIIYLQPECCAGDEGRIWCEDDEPEECEDGVKWSKYALVERDEISEWVDEFAKQQLPLDSEARKLLDQIAYEED